MRPSCKQSVPLVAFTPGNSAAADGGRESALMPARKRIGSAVCMWQLQVVMSWQVSFSASIQRWDCHQRTYCSRSLFLSESDRNREVYD
jgi:hypothetical protein